MRIIQANPPYKLKFAGSDNTVDISLEEIPQVGDIIYWINGYFYITQLEPMGYRGNLPKGIRIHVVNIQESDPLLGGSSIYYIGEEEFRASPPLFPGNMILLRENGKPIFKLITKVDISTGLRYGEDSPRRNLILTDL